MKMSLKLALKWHLSHDNVRGNDRDHLCSSAGSVRVEPMNVLGPEGRTEERTRRRDRMEEEGSSSQFQTIQKYSGCCRISSVLSPFPPSRVEAAGPYRCCGPTWPGLSWWTGLWCTGLCYEYLQTGLPRGWEHLDWPWQNPAQNPIRFCQIELGAHVRLMRNSLT